MNIISRIYEIFLKMHVLHTTFNTLIFNDDQLLKPHLIVYHHDIPLQLNPQKDRRLPLHPNKKRHFKKARIHISPSHIIPQDDGSTLYVVVKYVKQSVTDSRSTSQKSTPARYVYLFQSYRRCRAGVFTGARVMVRVSARRRRGSICARRGAVVLTLGRRCGLFCEVSDRVRF